MLKEIKLKQVLTIVKLSLLLIWFWPLPRETAKFKVLCMKLHQCVTIILSIIGIILMGYSFFKNLDDPHLVIESGLALFPCIHVIWNIISRIFIYQRLQQVTSDVETFDELLEPDEKAIIQTEYIDKCISFYGISVVSFYVAILFVTLLRPAILGDPFPASVDFPFDVYHQPLYTIIYIHQTLVCLQVAANLSVNAFMALLLWLTAAKFHLLTEKLQKITDIYYFIKCIEKHQELLEHAKEIASIVSPFALGSVISSTMSLIMCGLIFITGAQFTLKVECIIVGFSGLAEVFMYVWPAEHLIHTSSYVGQTVFETDWYNRSTIFGKNIQMVLLRSQKTVLVNLPCGMPPLSFSYYAAYLSSIFSYFTTLRLMFEEEENMV